jgi:hypothetical protein
MPCDDKAFDGHEVMLLYAQERANLVRAGCRSSRDSG